MQDDKLALGSRDKDGLPAKKEAPHVEKGWPPAEKEAQHMKEDAPVHKPTEKKEGQPAKKEAPMHKPAEKKKDDDAESADVSEISGKLVQKLADALKKKPYGCPSIKRSEKGWETIIEIVEEEHIPSKFDTIGVYEAQFDKKLNLTGWEKKKQRDRG